MMIQLQTILKNDSVENAVKLMRLGQCHALPVVEEGRCTGLLENIHIGNIIFVMIGAPFSSLTFSPPLSDFACGSKGHKG
jgi:hypothetical protein